jgi:hypothetical protein
MGEPNSVIRAVKNGFGNKAVAIASVINSKIMSKGVIANPNLSSQGHSIGSNAYEDKRPIHTGGKPKWPGDVSNSSQRV